MAEACFGQYLPGSFEPCMIPRPAPPSANEPVMQCMVLTPQYMEAKGGSPAEFLTRARSCGNGLEQPRLIAAID